MATTGLTIRKLHFLLAMAIGGQYGMPQRSHCSHQIRKLAEHSKQQATPATPE